MVEASGDAAGSEFSVSVVTWLILAVRLGAPLGWPIVLSPVWETILTVVVSPDVAEGGVRSLDSSGLPEGSHLSEVDGLFVPLLDFE